MDNKKTNDLFWMIRWAAEFIVNVHTKKTIKAERYLRLPGDIEEQRPKINKVDFRNLAERFDASANNREWVQQHK